MTVTLSQLADELEQDRATLERELAEIELLLRQASTEAERHEARRAQAEERLATLERNVDLPPEVAEARAQLLSQTRRQTLMQAQLEVLAGKQRALQRFQQRLAEALPIVRGANQSAAGSPGATTASDGGTAAGREVMAAQEQMRRDIARQMHDGPAQSIANIALQAQIVQRLFDRQPKLAGAELDELVKMVEHALEATKDFIFDVRPMVLDDLGLVPTLRRSTAERGRRSGIPVRFESIGADRRLSSELESALFRIIDDALAAYLDGRPAEVLVKLDWSEGGVRAVVEARARDVLQPAEGRARAAVAAARHEKSMPAALASMIREREHDDVLRATGLAEVAWAEISQRAASIGLSVGLSPDRAVLEVVASPRH